MNRDAVGSSQMGLNSGPNRIGFIGAPSLPDCCDVINIYAELQPWFSLTIRTDFKMIRLFIRC